VPQYIKWGWSFIALMYLLRTWGPLNVIDHCALREAILPGVQSYVSIEPARERARDLIRQQNSLHECKNVGDSELRKSRKKDKETITSQR
jgi:hypothetical protein